VPYLGQRRGGFVPSQSGSFAGQAFRGIVRAINILEILNRPNEQPESRPTLSPEFRERLVEEFRLDIERLSGLIERDLSDWWS